MRIYINERIQKNIQTTKKPIEPEATLQTQGHRQKTTPDRRSQFILFSFFFINFSSHFHRYIRNCDLPSSLLVEDSVTEIFSTRTSKSG